MRVVLSFYLVFGRFCRKGFIFFFILVDLLFVLFFLRDFISFILFLKEVGGELRVGGLSYLIFVF